jgi:hypothetical protein
MNKTEKLLIGILNNPRDVAFSDACKAAELIGFRRAGGKGSHVAYARPGEPVGLNFQNRNGRIPPYQARQLG